jgi:glyoxylase-like metal-dependent hydrolase (beta-lactamase superfamily II)/cell division septum initiation protein DivIVA
MPDQNSAASEHAILQEITQPLAELPHDPVSAVADVDFPLVLRGYDREAVDEYIRQTTHLVAELAATRSPEGAVRRALERVGEQVSSILARAHETAEEITSQSRAEAEERLMQARAESEELERDAHALADQLDRESRALAEQLERESEQKARERERAAELRVQELDAEVDRIWAERDRIVSDVRKLSEELSELAGLAATRFPAATTDEAAVVQSPRAKASSAASEPLRAPGQPDQRPGSEDEEHGPVGSEQLLSTGSRPEPVGIADAPDASEDQSEDPTGEQLSEPGAQWLEIPGDLRDERLATMEHAVPADEPDTEAPIAPPDLVEPPVGGPLAGPGMLNGSEQPTTVLQLPRVRVIDLHHLGIERVIGCWQIDDILIDPGPASCLEALLAEVQEPPRALLLTHIHLDHAGAAGSLVKRWPDLEVYVHEQGAAHLADPTRLLESAKRLYGPDMERLWGEFLPVPESNLRVLRGGEQLFDGRFEVAYTPGHASHHVSYLNARTAFVGDVAGVRITPETLTIPPTPPPDIDIEAWHASIDQLLRWKPDQLAMTHFGANDDIGTQLADLADRLDTWAALVHAEDLETFVGVVDEEIEHGVSPTNRAAYKQAAPPEQIYAGLDRYWRKRDGAPVDSEESARATGASEEEFLDHPSGSAGQPSTHAGRSAHFSRRAIGSD